MNIYGKTDCKQIEIKICLEKEKESIMAVLLCLWIEKSVTRDH